jgi:hypothetical protein
MVAVVFIVVLILRGGGGKEGIISAPDEANPTPIAVFQGEKAEEFYASQSYAVFNASRNIIGEFLINQENAGSNNVATVTINSFESDFGDNATFNTTLEFTSLDNNKTYTATIITYMDDSQSSVLRIEGYGFERSFGDVIN